MSLLSLARSFLMRPAAAADLIGRTSPFGPDGVLNILTDITSQRRLESELEHYVQIAAHDLREPLMAFGLFLEQLASWSTSPAAWRPAEPAPPRAPPPRAPVAHDAARIPARGRASCSRSAPSCYGISSAADAGRAGRFRVVPDAGHRAGAAL